MFIIDVFNMNFKDNTLETVTKRIIQIELLFCLLG